DDGQYNIAWDSDDVPMALRPEPPDDDNFCMYDLEGEVPFTPILAPTHSSAAVPPRVNKPRRGRPRKHPVKPTVDTAKKITRTKTGCFTCRRRKKCDEAKTRCMNCKSNAAVYEGYPKKWIWESGKE
ncbi:hypothetical protein QBC36DRAFT_146376, partial [Triangularia setosa]